MGAAEVIPFEEVRARKHWDALRHQLHERFDQWLDTLETQWHEPPATLAEMTATVWHLRQQLTGGLTEAMVAHVHRSEHDRTQVNCPRCDGVLRAQACVGRTVETMVGPVQMERPYFIVGFAVWAATPSTTHWAWWRDANSSICNRLWCIWPRKCRMTQPRRSFAI